MLNSLQLTLASNSSHPADSPAPDSPRSSISSASTSTFSGSSTRSALSGSSGSPRGVRRTQPYAAPYYAAMPGSAGASGASARRRAASCSREWRPEPVEEEEQGEDANALGLEFASDFGQRVRGRSSTPVRDVQTGPHRGRNGAGHRAAASESAVPLASAR
uniref:Cytochrome P450 51 n=1 Tax=Ganoderma boninense TaxID=34458 RepID=A0A5K1K2Z5_9APHY|nr:Cytochrome P450 51 [Ganoderma boninense]